MQNDAKRFVSIALVIMILFMYGNVIAEESNDKREEYLANLVTMRSLYELLPEEFTADRIMYTYLNFMLYMNSDTLTFFYTMYRLHNSDGSAAVESMRKYAISSAMIVKYLTDGYAEWLDGKLTDSDYTDRLMTIVIAIMDRDK